MIFTVFVYSNLINQLLSTNVVYLAWRITLNKYTAYTETVD